MKDEIKSKVKFWEVLDGYPHCDLLLIKNFSVNVVESANPSSFQPYEGIEKKIYQKVVAVDLKEKGETSTMDLLKVRTFTVDAIVINNINTLMHILNDISTNY